MTDTEALEEALKTVAAYSKRLERKNEVAEAVARESVRQLNQWQALANGLYLYAQHRPECPSASCNPQFPCTCGLSELRKNPLLQ